MKPCSKNRKLIAWLVLDALDARRATVLRDHFLKCEGCRRYAEEMSNVTKRLAAAQPDSGLEASAWFHRGVAERLRVLESGSTLENATARLRGTILSWQVALPTIVGLVIAAVAMVTLRQHPAASPPGPPTVEIASASSPSSDLAPTLANYQMVASQSLEKLDELLTQQGNKRLPPASVFTASGFALADASF